MCLLNNNSTLPTPGIHTPEEAVRGLNEPNQELKHVQGKTFLGRVWSKCKIITVIALTCLALGIIAGLAALTVTFPHVMIPIVAVLAVGILVKIGYNAYVYIKDSNQRLEEAKAATRRTQEQIRAKLREAEQGLAQVHKERQWYPLGGPSPTLPPAAAVRKRWTRESDQ